MVPRIYKTEKKKVEEIQLRLKFVERNTAGFLDS